MSNGVFQEMQESTYTWYSVLNSTGGASKPEKCSWWLINYEFKGSNWAYSGEVEWNLSVPFPDGSEEHIQQKSVHTAVEALGVWVFPAGTDDDQLKKIFKKDKQRTHKMTNGYLPAKYAWVLYRLKLWPVLRYRLATMATPFKISDTLLRKLEFKMLSVLGVNRNIKQERRTIP